MVLNKISIVSNYNNITNKDCIEDSKDTGDRNKGIKYILEIRGIKYGKNGREIVKTRND